MANYFQEGRATYRSQNWDASVLVRDFQVLTTSNNLPYRLMPQLGTITMLLRLWIT
ncbi:LPS assembly protein LptD [Vibrio lentus]|nr:LPS assembly protein LptD [Vibrio lentus]